MVQSFSPSPFGACGGQQPLFTSKARIHGSKSPDDRRLHGVKIQPSPSGGISGVHSPGNKTASSLKQAPFSPVPASENATSVRRPELGPHKTKHAENANTSNKFTKAPARKDKSDCADSDDFRYERCFFTYDGTCSPSTRSESDPLSRPSTPPAVLGESEPTSLHKARTLPLSKVQAKEDLAKMHRIPEGYSLKNWDPEETPLLLLGSVFDCNSLGKWIYDWTVYHHSASAPISDMAGELWLLLIQLAGKVKRSEEVVRLINSDEDREIVLDFLESGDRLVDKLRELLKRCERPMLKAIRKSYSRLDGSGGVEFVEALFGRERELNRTERFMAGVRLFNIRFDVNCEGILQRAGRLAVIMPPEDASKPGQAAVPPSPATSEEQSSGDTGPHEDFPDDTHGESPDSTTSVDTESTTFSDFSEGERLDTDHPFYPDVCALVKIAVAGYEEWMACPQEDGGKQDSASRGSGGGKNPSPRSRRRPRGQDEEDARVPNEGSSNDGKKRRKSGGDAEEEEGEVCLACPYYKSDRYKYSDCLKYRLKRIKDVKQHLNRVHKQPHYCPSCGLEFDTQTQQIEHSRVQQCLIRDYPRPDGVTQDQRDELSLRVDRKMARGEQWFTVWDVVFPGRPRPGSPFVETHVHEVLSGVREYWSEQGPGIVAAYLGGRRDTMPNEERSLGMISLSALDNIMGVFIDRCFERFSAPATQNQAAGSESVSGNPSTQTTTDEGVADVRSASTCGGGRESLGSFVGGIPRSMTVSAEASHLPMPGQFMFGSDSFGLGPGVVEQGHLEDLAVIDICAWADLSTSYGDFRGDSFA